MKHGYLVTVAPIDGTKPSGKGRNDSIETGIVSILMSLVPGLVLELAIHSVHRRITHIQKKTV